MRLTKRKDVISAVEEAVGVILPSGLRQRLIADGEALIRTNCRPDRDIRVSIAPVPIGEVLFADERGSALRDLDDWYEDALNWHLTTRSYLIANLGQGDYLLLAPDETGVARRLVLADSSVRELHLTGEDIDTLLVAEPEMSVA